MIANVITLAKQLTYALYVTPSELAIWALCFFVFAIFSAYGTLGFSMIGTRNMSLEIAEGAQLVSNRWSKVIALICLVSIVPFFIGVYFFLYGGPYASFKILTVIVLFVFSNYLFQIALYQIAFTNPLHYSKILAVRAVVTLLSGVLCLTHVGIIGVIYIEIVTSIIFAFWYLRLWIFRVKLELNLINASTIKESFKFLFASAGASLNLQIERFVAIKMLSQVDFGILNFGMILSTVAAQLQYAGSVLLVPRLAKMVVENRIREIYIQIMQLIALGITCAVVLAALLRPMINMIVEGYYSEYSLILDLYWGVVLLATIRALEFASLVFTQTKQTNLLVLMMVTLSISSLFIYLYNIVFSQTVVTVVNFGVVFTLQALAQGFIVFAFLLFSFIKTQR